MERIIQKLKEKGCKITPQRRAIIQSLLNFSKFPTALEVFNDIKATNPDVGLDTIYRNLNLLVEIGIVNSINLPGKDVKVFELSIDGHHHHLVCLSCGQADCLDYCPIDEQRLQTAAGSEFKITGHSLEIYGYCQKCKSTHK
ncbi:Fur family transcriptional regulator [Sporomusa ovata]|uniref:Zinc uptake regulation protein ZUR n=1 Tax=Sporomusa ovata TaxID=2378 RepID=A0A0U1L1N9_9FIRM|nr:Fur family transcriptional regulator [Sporomusa ovata]CQR73239.1 Zinc uptake regulation protein ZUR [Sporomusa ovata]